MNSINENVKIIDTKDIQAEIVMNYINKVDNPFRLLSVQEVSRDLHIGINQAYDLFKQSDFPTITIGKRKTVTLASYLLWKMSKKGGV